MPLANPISLFFNIFMFKMRDNQQLKEGSLIEVMPRVLGGAKGSKKTANVSSEIKASLFTQKSYMSS